MRARTYAGVGLVGVASVAALVSTGRTGTLIAGGFLLGAVWIGAVVALGRALGRMSRSYERPPTAEERRK